MEGEVPEQPQQGLEEATTRDGRRVRLQKGKPPKEVNPTTYDKTAKPVPPEIIGEVVDLESEDS